MREASAAQAALALVRRIAKVGPDTPLEAIARRYSHLCRSLGSAHADDLMGGTKKASGNLETTARGRGARHVHFDLSTTIVHEVVPYSETYGLHPREFVFDRDFYMVPAGGTFGFTDMIAADRKGAATMSAEDDDSSESSADSDVDDVWGEDSDEDSDCEYDTVYTVTVHDDCSTEVPTSSIDTDADSDVEEEEEAEDPLAGVPVQ